MKTDLSLMQDVQGDGKNVTDNPPNGENYD
jgi:hypothetical protein